MFSVCAQAILKQLRAFWDFVDARDIDKHAVSVAIMFGTYSIIRWSMGYADANIGKPGIDVAAVLAAVNAPYMALQAAAISFYFNSRPST